MPIFVDTIFVDKYTPCLFLLTIFWPSENATKKISQEIQNFLMETIIFQRAEINLFFKEQKNNRLSFVEPWVSRVPPQEFRPKPPIRRLHQRLAVHYHTPLHLRLAVLQQ